MAILSGPILVALAVSWSGRFLNWATSTACVDVVVLGIVTTVQHALQVSITLCGFFVPLYIQGPWDVDFDA